MSKQAKKQTRRTISLSYGLFWAFWRYCRANELKLAAVVSRLVTALLVKEGWPVRAEKPDSMLKGPPPEKAGGHFSW